MFDTGCVCGKDRDVWAAVLEENTGQCRDPYMLLHTRQSSPQNNTVVSPDDGHLVIRNVQRLINILRINCASSWLYLQDFMHGIKFKNEWNCTMLPQLSLFVHNKKNFTYNLPLTHVHLNIDTHTHTHTHTTNCPSCDLVMTCIHWSHKYVFLSLHWELCCVMRMGLNRWQLPSTCRCYYTS